MDKRAYWIWLQNAFGPGSAKPRQIVERAGSPEAFHRGGIGLWSSFSFISDKELNALSMYGPEQAQAMLQYCLNLGQKVITPDSGLYPTMLKEIFNPPAVLYLRGEMPDFAESLWIGVVGTRKAGQTGLNAARDIGYQLAGNDVVVVSGGALGVDSEAHRGALRGGGKTAAFLPCGLDYPYLMDNALLRREILDCGGALISEFPMNTPVQRGAFQIRNRLISGVSHGVFVAEASKKSGALITARHALEQNREVFVFVGPEEKDFVGCTELMEDGAKRVFTAEDILKSFAQRRQAEKLERIAAAVEQIEESRPARRAKVRFLSDSEVPATEIAEPETDAAEMPEELQEESVLPEAVLMCSEAAQTVFGALGETPLHASEIEEKLDLSAGEILAALTELELFGLIRTFPGQRFTKA